MHRLQLFIVWVVLPIFLSIFCIVWYDNTHMGKKFLRLLRSSLCCKETPYGERKSFEFFHSSVLCRGSNHTNRLCNFENLCFEPVTESYIFFHNVKSILSGVPGGRFSPALADFSSVYDHNTQYFNYVDLPESAISKFNVTYILGHSLIFKRFNPENLMHVFHDDLIPAFLTLKELSFLNNDIRINKVFFAFADGKPPGPYADIYEKFLIETPLYLKSLSTDYLYCFQNAHIGLNKLSLWYQYGFKEPQGPIVKHLSDISPVILNFRDYFIKKFSLPQTHSENSALLLTRAHNRKIINENEIVKTIEAHTNLNTKIVNLENYTVIQVIEEIISSQVVVGMHGSLLILSLFLPPFSLVLELFPYAVSPDISTPYKTLALIPSLKLVYKSWENKIPINTVCHPEYPPEYGGLYHLPTEEQERIKNSVVLPFLCCYNPEWLYRIYQDTVVDPKSFSELLKNAYKKLQLIKANAKSIGVLFPGEVQNLNCTVSNESRTVTVFWKKPWNLNFINVTSIEYELWYQVVNTNDVKAFIMKKTSFVLPIVSSTDTYYIWVRCYIDGKVGPFNSNPLICDE